MKTCLQIQELLIDLCRSGEDTLSSGDLRSHLEQCAECRSALDQELSLRADLGKLPLVVCPTRVSNRILAEIEIDSTRDLPHRRIRRNWLPAAGLVAAAAIVLAIMLPETAPTPATDISSAATSPTNNDQEWSPQQIATARKEALWSLTTMAKIIDKSEKATITEIFGRRLPGAISGSLRNVLEDHKGGQG